MAEIVSQRAGRSRSPARSHSHETSPYFFVSIRLPSGNEVDEIMLCGEDRISALRRAVEESDAAITRVHFDFAFEGRILKDEALVKDVGLAPGSVVLMVRCKIYGILVSVADDSVRMFNHPGGLVRIFRRGPLKIKHDFLGMEYIAVSKDGKYIVALHIEENRVIVFDVASGSVVRTWSGHGVWGASFDTGGTKVLVASEAGTKLLSIESRALETISALPSQFAVFSRDEAQLLIVGFGDSEDCHIIERASGAIVQTFRKPGFPMSRAVFSADESLVLASCGRGCAHLFNRRSGVLLGSFGIACPIGKAHETCNVAIFSPDECRILATCARKPRAQLYDIASGATVHIFPHQDRVNSVSFSPDGVFILTSSSDGSSKVFDACSGQLARILKAQRFGRQPPAALYSTFVPLEGGHCI